MSLLTLLRGTTSTTVAALATLTDTFDTLNPRWTQVGGANVRGGLLRMPTTIDYSNVTSSDEFSLLNSSIYFQVVTLPRQDGSGTLSNNTEFGLTLVSVTNPGYSLGDLSLFFGIGNQMVLGRGGDLSQMTFDPAWTWWRISEAAGTTTFSSSTDGFTWTPRMTKPTTAYADRYQVQFFSGYFATTTNPHDFVIDNLNLPGRLPTFTDNFTHQNTALWWNWGTDIVFSPGQVSIAAVATYPLLTNTRPFPLGAVESAATVRAVSLPNLSNGSTQMYLELFIGSDGMNRLDIGWINNSFVFEDKIAGVVSQGFTTYVPTHVWWRLRILGTTVYWETSPDNVTWTTRQTKTIPWVATTAINVGVGAGNWNTAPSPGTAVFADVSVKPIAARSGWFTNTGGVEVPALIG